MDSQVILNRIVHYAPDLGLTYLSIPKVACSSFKRSIWEAIDKKNNSVTLVDGLSPHRKDRSPFVRSVHALRANLDGFVGSEFFVVVRNPYSRLLSAYLDKVAREKRDLKVWQVVAAQLQYRPGERPPLL